nr:uncharacterized protein c57a7.05 [Quercus suber]
MGVRDDPQLDTSSGDASKTQDEVQPASSAPEKETSPDKKPSTIRRLWDTIGLDIMTVSLMFKGSLPPIIAIAMYQSQAVAQHFKTLGYLVAIASILGFCIMPRGKFIQTMALEVVAVCFGAAVNLLALYCAVKVRQHTAAPGTSPLTYNSSASAVLAIWLCVQLYFVNVLRASRPQFQFPAILYSIFVVVSFMKQLLEAFLTGFALATGVHFIVFPTSSRKVVLKEMTGYLMSLNGMLKAQGAFMVSLEDFDPVSAREQAEQLDLTNQSKKKAKTSPPGTWNNPAATKLREAVAKTVELHTKLHGDITPAKREFALGKLESHDLTELWRHLRRIFIPIIGLSSTLELLQKRAMEANWGYEGVTESERHQRHEQIHNLRFLMKEMHAPFAKMSDEIEKGIQHVLITLELVKPPKTPLQDEESNREGLIPGTAGFMDQYRTVVHDFHKSKEKTLEEWCQEHNIEIPQGFFDENFTGTFDSRIQDEEKRRGSQRQLFFALYLEYLLFRASESVLDAIMFAEKRKSEGVLKHTRLIFPGSKTLYKWLKATFAQEDMTKESHFVSEMDSAGAEGVFLGADFNCRKDPEHLPPRNAFESIGDGIRKIPRFFRSDASAFGVRVVLATMSIGIVCYLATTQSFFLKQRLLWSLFNFVLRVLGTAVAMVGAYIVWYIVDGKAPGVIVFLWLWTMGSFYFIVKIPRFIVVAILSVVTAILIIGYELQVGVIGTAVVESNGQPAYPIYLLAPYRLATVAGGIFVAFIWTIFPFPISENTEIRKDLGATLYLLSNFYSIVHETVRSRVHGTDGDTSVKGTHAYNLDKARGTVFNKLMLLLTTLKTNAAFGKFQLRVGGRFPHEKYERCEATAVNQSRNPADVTMLASSNAAVVSYNTSVF